MTEAPVLPRDAKVFFLHSPILQSLNGCLNTGLVRKRRITAMMILSATFSSLVSYVALSALYRARLSDVV